MSSQKCPLDCQQEPWKDCALWDGQPHQRLQEQYEQKPPQWQVYSAKPTKNYIYEVISQNHKEKWNNAIVCDEENS